MTTVTLIWLKDELVSMHLGDQLIYKSPILLPADGEYSEMTVPLSLIQATKFCSYMSRGIAIEELQIVLEQTRAKIKELAELEMRTAEIDTNIDLGGW